MFSPSFKPTLLAGAMLAILGFQTAAEADAQFQMKNTPIVIGHRGTAGNRPDHTIEGYTLAIEMGADFIEPDLVLTKDGHMVARHEPMIGGTTDVASHPEFASRKTKRMVDGVEYNDWFATDFTLAEIKTLRAVQPLARRDQQYNGQFEIPTLDEVIALTKSQSKTTGRSIGIYPEIKHSTYHAELKGKKNHKLFGLNFFENKLINKLHKAYSNSACAPVFIQSFEVSNLQYLSHKTNIQLVQLVDADDVNADGSMSLVAPYKQPYDFVVSGDTRTFADLLTNEGLSFIKSYADAVGPWKPYLVKTVDTDGNINHRNVVGSTGVVEMAHDKGLLVHTWTFRNDASGYGFTNPEAEMKYYYDLGVDGLFTDYADTGVLARDTSINASNVSSNNQCKVEHEEQDHENHDHRATR